MAYNRGQAKPTEVHDESNGSSATTPSQWPTHARKPKQTMGSKSFTPSAVFYALIVHDLMYICFYFWIVSRWQESWLRMLERASCGGQEIEDWLTETENQIFQKCGWSLWR